MNVKAIVAGVAALVVLIATICTWNGLVGWNDYQDWQVYQSVGGNVEIIDSPGYYIKAFGKVWTYPRAIEAHYQQHGTEVGESIKVTFNDGGTADVSAYVRIQLPPTRNTGSPSISCSTPTPRTLSRRFKRI